MIIKSTLMVPADNDKYLTNIDKLNCNMIIINLEDGVYNKKKARKLLKTKFQDKKLKIKNKLVVVRINSLDSCGKKDNKIINKLQPDAIRIPKINNVKEIKKALKLIDKNIDIHLSIETKEALHNLKKFKISNRITIVHLGILDMLESFGLSQSILTLDNPIVNYILSKFLIDSKIANLYPISFIYQKYRNIKIFKKWCKKEKNMGFLAKGCISPTQVNIVNDIFTMDKHKIIRAKKIKKLFEKYQKIGKTGFSHKKYGFIDEPIYKDALLILKLN